MTLRPAALGRLVERLRRIPARWVDAIAVALLVVWGVWWGISLWEGQLLFADRTWITHPAFGVDFWTQTDLAARKWHAGQDPYADHVHLFHYPPIVIRLFSWTPLFEVMTALRIWIVVLAVTLLVGVWGAVRARRDLGLQPVSFPAAAALTLYSFPALFALERSNFDLITLMVIVAAWALFRWKSAAGDGVGGALLAIGPWVKIYPGLLGVGLFGLRRFWAVGGFVLAGLGIGLAALQETMRSFHVLALAIRYARPVVTRADFFPWGHSVSIAWWKLGRALGVQVPVPASAIALVLLSPLLLWVVFRVYRTMPRQGAGGRDRGSLRAEAALALPVLLWVTALGSFVPQIANDYSLVFLPLAALVVWRWQDPWPLQAGLAMLVVCLQPVALPIPGWVLLGLKVAGLAAIGAAIARRAEEQRAGRELDPASA